MQKFRDFINEATDIDPGHQAAIDELVGVINKYLPKVKYEHRSSDMWEMTSRMPPKYNQKLMKIWDKEGYTSGGVIDGKTSHVYTKDGKYRANFGIGRGAKSVEIVKA